MFVLFFNLLIIFLVSFRFCFILLRFCCVSFRFVSFLLVSFRFVSVLFLVLQSPFSQCVTIFLTHYVHLVRKYYVLTSLNFIKRTPTPLFRFKCSIFHFVCLGIHSYILVFKNLILFIDLVFFYPYVCIVKCINIL
jgi:hypothetical protein